MAQYPAPDPSSIRGNSYKANPLTLIKVTGQGKESHPVPPAAPGPWRAKKPAPVTVKAPGIGTI